MLNMNNETSHSPKEINFKENDMKCKTNGFKFSKTLNPKNVLVTKNDIQNILKKGNITDEINDLSIWQKSFVHKSFVYKDINNIKYCNTNLVTLQKSSNERLEWLGDAQLQSAVSYYLWKRYPDKDEGFLTKLRSKLVKTKNLSFLSKKIGLTPFLLISYHVEYGCQGRTNLRILENTFESFIGALLVDFSNKVNSSYGYEITKKFIINIIEKYVDIVELLINDENSKDQLMWYFQKKFNGAYPIYIKEKYENECFYVYILEPDTDIIVGRGHARSKKQSEQNAAKNALSFYAEKDMKK